MWQAGAGAKTTVNRVEIRGSRLDPVLSGQRLNFLLNHTGVYPAGLSSEAILCIRHLRDPLPGTLRLEKAGELMPAPWEKAISGKLAQLVQQAARPASGPVVGGVEAVIFESRAELLACLAQDWCARRIGAGWWWQSLFGQRLSQELQIISIWQDAPEYVPPALQWLAERGIIQPFVKNWEIAPAQLMLRRLVQRFALSELETGLSEALLSDNPGSWANLSNNSGQNLISRPISHKNSNSGEQPKLAPWQEIVPESRAADLNLVQTGLIGVGLMLYRAPQKLRTRAFAQEIAAWVNSRTASVTPQTFLEKPSTLPPSHNVTRQTPRASALPFNQSTEAMLLEQPSNIPRLVFSQAEQTENIPSSKSNIFKPEIKFATDADLENSQEAPEGFVETGASPETGLKPIELPKGEIITEFAGLFYLINLGLFLEFYGDFTNPARPGLALPIWDFLALVGENFCGKRLHQDSVWEWLAKLAGRSAEEKPGQNFEPPENWRLPPEWLKPFPEKNWSWTEAAGRLRVKHPSGFLVLDVALETAIGPERQLFKELEPYAGVRAKKRASKNENSSEADSLQRWLDWLLLYLKARLGRALGTTSSRAGRLLCRQPGRINLRDSHIEIRLKLAQLPLEIRLAGLDRDPGWVPAAGRYITFIFE